MIYCIVLIACVENVEVSPDMRTNANPPENIRKIIILKRETMSAKTRNKKEIPGKAVK